MKDEWYIRAANEKWKASEVEIVPEDGNVVEKNEDGAWVQARVWIPRADVGVVIHGPCDLALYVEASVDTDDDLDALEKSIRRRLYKDTKCGIGFAFWGHTGIDKDGQRVTIGSPKGISVEGYCEGDVGDCEAHELEFPFLGVELDEAVERADQDGCDLWDETHGCECCGEPNEHGHIAVNPDCKECGGAGRVI